VRLRVLDFELPAPKTYHDVEKDFLSLFCEYVNIEWIRCSNGNDSERKNDGAIKLIEIPNFRSVRARIQYYHQWRTKGK